jgi:hypothetical protein
VGFLTNFKGRSKAEHQSASRVAKGIRVINDTG